MTFPTEPRHLERLAVVVVMLLGYWIAAHGAWLGKKFSPALVHVGICTGNGSLALLFR